MAASGPYNGRTVSTTIPATTTKGNTNNRGGRLQKKDKGMIRIKILSTSKIENNNQPGYEWPIKRLTPSTRRTTAETIRTGKAMTESATGTMGMVAIGAKYYNQPAVNG